jgi:hypothetical protein
MAPCILNLNDIQNKKLITRKLVVIPVFKSVQLIVVNLYNSQHIDL